MSSKFLNYLLQKLFSLRTTLNKLNAISFFKTFFCCFNQQIQLGDWWKPLCINQSRFCISYLQNISKIINITSKHFLNTPPVNSSTHITKYLFTYYSCSYYGFMVRIFLKFLKINWILSFYLSSMIVEALRILKFQRKCATATF